MFLSINELSIKSIIFFVNTMGIGISYIYHFPADTSVHADTYDFYSFFKYMMRY